MPGSRAQQLSPKRLQILEEIKQIASPNHAFKNYVEKLRTINPPCVPFLGEEDREWRPHLHFVVNISVVSCTNRVLYIYTVCVHMCIENNGMKYLYFIMFDAEVESM